MGLISDYLEENRERGNGGFVDPCLIMGSSHNYHVIHENLLRYEAAKKKEKEDIARQLISQISELEQLKHGYLLADKALLEVINFGNLQSRLMQDILNSVDDQVQDNYRGICETINDIDKKLNHPCHTQIKPVGGGKIRDQLLELIMGGILYMLRNRLPLDTSSFRKVIHDCAELIRHFRQENYLLANKKIVQYYIEKHFDIKTGHHKCINCGQPMKIDIPYCLNCYERNM